MVGFINNIIYKFYLRRYMKKAGQALLDNREKELLEYLLSVPSDECPLYEKLYDIKD